MTSCAANSINVITSYTRGITYPTCDDYLHSVTTCTTGATYPTCDDYLHPVTTCTTGATYPTYDDYLHLIKSGAGGTTLIAAVWIFSFTIGQAGTTDFTFITGQVGTTGSTFAIALTFSLFQISFSLFPQPAIIRMSGVFPMPVWSRFFHSRFFCEVHHD